MDRELHRYLEMYRRYESDGYAPGAPRKGGSREKWGDAQVLPFLGPAQPNPETLMVDVGPFPTPRPVSIRMNASPRVQLPASGRGVTRWRFRMLVGVGDSAYMEPSIPWGAPTSDINQTSQSGLTMLPREVVCSSLQIWAAREQQTLPNPTSSGPFENPRLSMWAAPGGAYGGQPSIFAFDNYIDVAIGVGDVDIQTPPMTATHAVLGNANKGMTTTARVALMYFCDAAAAGGNSLGNQAGNQLMPFQRTDQPINNVLPIGVNGLKYVLRRDPTTAQESFSVFWLR